MLNKNDIVKIHIDDLSIEGAGIGRHNGFAVFVPKALPDETVSAKIIKVTKSYAVAHLLSVEQFSAHRIKPFCSVFETCGGCTLQHMDYRGQLKFKARYIKECFKRLGGFDIKEPEVLAADNIRNYRNKASFPVSEIDGKVKAGFYARRSHRLVDNDCSIQKQPINDIKNAVIDWANDNGILAYDETKNSGALRHIIGRQTSTGDLMAGIVMRGKIDEKSLVSALKDISGIKSIVINTNNKKTNTILGGNNHTVFGNSYITENFNGLTFRTGLSSFLQVNHDQAEKLYDKAIEFAGITKHDIVFDLFCGIGTLSLLAAKKAKRVLGIEYVQSAVTNAKENAKLNYISNAIFLAGDAEQMLDQGIQRMGKPDIMILNPPRKGCDCSLIEKNAAILPRRIVYISCNPATLARDASIFCKHGYSLNKIKGIDMFPHTTHVECVVLMTRK
ncbi:MAG: 23S rRNA (uracil(1939)-C(5))-methyltransferase RlmD [Christensenellales bacterium]